MALKKRKPKNGLKYKNGVTILCDGSMLAQCKYAKGLIRLSEVSEDWNVGRCNAKGNPLKLRGIRCPNESCNGNIPLVVPPRKKKKK